MKHSTRRLVLAALFLALGLVLPFVTGQIPQIGGMLLPMHLPVLLCGFVCGGPWGLAVGFVTPLLRSLIFGMPPLFPTALGMAFELAAYGLLAGLFYRWLPQRPAFLYLALVLAMAGGRAIWGLAQWALMALVAKPFTGAIFLAGAVGNALPGILLQLVILPPLVMLFRKARMIDEK